MNKKGFTLIELLAVIVILAIIALIAVPIVLNIIERSRSGAAKSSAMSYIKATETYIVLSKMDKNKEQLVAGESYLTSKLNDLVELKGTKPTEGNVVISNKNSVASARLVINGYVIIYNGDDNSYIIEGKEDTPNYEYLSDVVSVGDYINYDAGTWTETKAKPTSQGNFGGYTSGTSKNASVEWCYYSASYKTEMKGWSVLKIDSATKTVTLVHAGQPECYYHGTNPTDSISKLNARATSEYMDTKYAESAHMMNYDEAYAITGSTGNTTDNLRYIGVKGTTSNNADYWSATANPSNANSLWSVYSPGSFSSVINGSFGIRPVIELKANIKTSGKGLDEFDQEAWTLVAP